MTDKTLPTPVPRSAFLKDSDNPRHHIVDTLIKERCPSFVSHWSWPVTRPLLYTLLGYGKARRTTDHLRTLNGAQSFDFLSDELKINLTLHQIERMPKTGRMIVAANHPTGLADGVAIWDALKRVRTDLKIFANADAIRVSESFSDVLIPVEWVMDKRSPAKTRETLALAKQAFAEEKCVVIFPSGKLAKKEDGVLMEHEWMSSVVGLARKYKAPIQPVNMQAMNSWLYYYFSDVNGELRDITLFHELLNKKNSHFEFTFGPLIQPETLEGEALALTEKLKNYVSYSLKENADQVFNP